MISIWIWIIKLCKTIKSKFRIKDGPDKKDQLQNYHPLFYLVFIKLILKVLVLLLLRQDFKKIFIEKQKLKNNLIFIKTNRLKI